MPCFLETPVLKFTLLLYYRRYIRFPSSFLIELLHAVRYNNIEKVKKLLTKSNADTCDENKKTLLIWASFRGYEKMCRILLKQGAKLDIRDSQGLTALHEAAQNGHVQVCSLLLKYKANVNKKDAEGWTPLMAASLIGHVEICKLLLKNGASADKQSNDGYSSLHVAAQNGQEGVCLLLLDNNADINKKDNYGFTALHLAAQNGQKSVCKFLLQKNAFKDIQDDVGCTPLMTAAVCGQAEICEYLLKNKARLNCKSEFGNTALHWAVKYKKFEVCQVLLQYGADINDSNSKGKSAKEMAKETNDEVISSLIKGFNKLEEAKKEIATKGKTFSKIEDEKTQMYQLKESVSGKEVEVNNLQSEIDFWKKDVDEKKNKLRSCKMEAGKAMLQKQIRDSEQMLNSLNEQLAQTREQLETWQNEISKLEPISPKTVQEKKEYEKLDKCFQEGKNDDILKQFKKECPICFVVMTPLVKIYQCSQGHWLCETCFEKTRETSHNCAFCREDIVSNPIRNRGLEEIIQNN